MVDYSTKTKDELIELLKLRDKTIKENKKYGLVWDDEKIPEKVVEDCKNNLPVLELVNDKTLSLNTNNKDTINHLLIEGDNYHTLNCLNYTHKNNIDLIYIDPPYNTGNKDFIYNDTFVNKEDSYRHSKWLNFMYKRLKIAKNLLKDEGVIFISIDDNEQANLKLLCDNVFGEENFVCNFVRNIPDGNNINKISITHEYLLMYKKYKIPNLYVEFEENSIIDDRITKNGNNKSQIKFPCGLKSTFMDKRIYNGNIGGKAEPITVIGDMVFENGILKNDVILEAQWAMPNILKSLFDGKRIFDKKGQEYELPYFTNTGVPHIRKIRKSGIFRSVQIWNNSNELEKIIGRKVFNNPKPISMIKTITNLVTKYNPSATILDFFCGSGTTAQAVLELNAEDGGNRKCIVCTNNENGICENVTYPRIKKVMEKLEINNKENNKEEILNNKNNNFYYLKTALIPISLDLNNITDKEKIDFTLKADSLIQIKEDVFNDLYAKKYLYRIFTNNNYSKILSIYYSVNLNEFDNMLSFLKEQILKNKNIKELIFYIFSINTLDKESYNYVINYFKDYKKIKVRIEDIPEPVLEVYKLLNVVINK